MSFWLGTSIHQQVFFSLGHEGIRACPNAKKGIILFHQKGKQAKSSAAKPVKIPKGLVAVLSPVEILAGDKRQGLIQHIKESGALDAKCFNELSLKLINQMTNYCQQLPETANSYYALPGGMLDYALNRTEAALQLFRQFIIQPEGKELSEIQKLWLYAMFSASLLKDIGKLQIDYLVKVFDPFGEPLKSWNPLIESLVSAGSYYQFEFLPDNEDKTHLRRRLNLLIARLLMPQEGFAWIASNPEVLAVWLALLSDDWQSAGTLGAILIRADAVAIQRYFNEHMIHHVGRSGGRAARISTFIDIKPDANLAKEQMLGVEFIKWMTALLDSGQLMLNKPPLLVVPGGLLIHPDAFKLFVRAHPEYKNWQSVQSGFLSLNLHRMNANGEALSRFEQSNNHQMHEGILFKNYAIALPNILKMHNISTGRAAQMSATEFIYMAQYNHLFVEQGHHATPKSPQHLTASGQWKTITAGLSQKPGFIKGG